MMRGVAARMTEKEMKAVAEYAAGYFETAKREEGGTFTRTKTDTPSWITDLVRKAHGDLLPDDWKYDCIEAALDHIAEDGSEDPGEFADGYVDVYTSDLQEWLSSHLWAAAHTDRRRDFGLPFRTR